MDDDRLELARLGGEVRGMRREFSVLAEDIRRMGDSKVSRQEFEQHREHMAARMDSQARDLVDAKVNHNSDIAAVREEMAGNRSQVFSTIAIILTGLMLLWNVVGPFLGPGE